MLNIPPLPFSGRLHDVFERRKTGDPLRKKDKLQLNLRLTRDVIIQLINNIFSTILRAIIVYSTVKKKSTPRLMRFINKN